MVVTVVEGTDPSITQDGTGHAGPTMNESQFATRRDRLLAEGKEIVDRTAASLPGEVETRVIEGSAGMALCQFAEEVSADAIVMGTRGRGRCVGPSSDRSPTMCCATHPARSSSTGARPDRRGQPSAIGGS